MTGKDYKERLKEISIKERKEMYRINKHDVELIKIMLQMQEKLDEQILKEHNISEINEDLLRNQDIEEITYYSAKGACSSDECYEDYKELIKEEYEKLGIEVLEGYE